MSYVIRSSPISHVEVSGQQSAEVLVRGTLDPKIVIRRNDTPDIVVKNQPVLTRVVQVSSPVPSGTISETPSYIHTQTSPASVWTINHNLGFFPNITVFSPGGIEVEASVLHTSMNQVVIEFEIPYTGTAIAR